jgi:adenosylcobinamide-phosphate synthase
MRDHHLTESPNAGWPMSVAAGTLGVRLEKRRHYLLGHELPEPDVSYVYRMVRLLYAISGVFAALAFGGGVVAGFFMGKK